ncbi:MAG: mechanosensitive ion channel family protein [Proteobacteria bacterium]|nr:mechanosensitive ion channel family protein [Pseudomonadota bacterium]
MTNKNKQGRSFCWYLGMIILFLMPQNLQAAEVSVLRNMIPESMQWLNYSFAYQEVWQWCALAFGFLVVLIFHGLVKIVWRLIERGTKVTKFTWDDQLIVTIKDQSCVLITLLFTHVYVMILGLSEGLSEFLRHGINCFIALSLYLFLYKLTDIIPSVIKRLEVSNERKIDPAVSQIFVRVCRITILILWPLFVLQNFGFNVASVLAGLGFAGLALSLAAKDTASNFFGSLMILLDKPFKIGDWVIIGDKEGSIMDIGLRSTRIRTFYDSVITVPNALIMTDVVDNMGQRQFRRIKTTLDICYDTSPANIQAFIQKVKDILAHHPNTEKSIDQHVVLSEFRESSLGVLLYFFLQVSDWKEELLVREELFLSIIKAAEDQNVQFAFPTRVLHLANPKQTELQNLVASKS